MKIHQRQNAASYVYDKNITHLTKIVLGIPEDGNGRRQCHWHHNCATHHLPGPALDWSRTCKGQQPITELTAAAPMLHEQLRRGRTLLMTVAFWYVAYKVVSALTTINPQRQHVMGSTNAEPKLLAFGLETLY